MKTILVALKNKNALQILKDLEMVNLIKILPSENKKSIMSKTLRRSLTKEKSEALRTQLKAMRGEWN